eukprot:RCo047278
MSFIPPEGTAEWVCDSLSDYLDPVHWKIKHEYKDCILEKKVQGEHEIPLYKVSGVIRSTTLEKVVDIIWTRFLETAHELNESHISGHILEELSPAACAAIRVDEGHVWYQQQKLPVVDNRDMVTLSVKKSFTRTGSTGRGVATFSKSVSHPSAPPVPKGFKRGEVLTCCAFIEEVPGGVRYTYTQQANMHFMDDAATRKIVQTGLKSHMHDYFGRLARLTQK